MAPTRTPAAHEVEIEVHDDVVFYDVIAGRWGSHTGAIFRGGAIDGIGYDALACLGSGRHAIVLVDHRRTGDAWPVDEDDLSFLKFRFERFVDRNNDRRSITALIMAFSPRNHARVEPLMLPWMHEELRDFARRVEQAGRSDGFGITYYGTSHVTEPIPAANVEAIIAWARSDRSGPAPERPEAHSGVARPTPGRSISSTFRNC